MRAAAAQGHHWLAAAVAVAVLLARVSVPGAGHAASVENEADARVRTVQNKLRLLDRLVNDSPTAKRLAASGDAQVRRVLENARKALATAHSALAAGATAEAESRADEALQQVSRSSRSVLDEGAARAAAREHYRVGRERVALFIEALGRAWRERGDTAADHEAEMLRLREALASATRLAAAGDHGGANEMLRELSVSVERSLSEARRNQTLLHELKFESPAQELAYELERNRSFALLLHTLATQQGGESRASYLAQLAERNSALREEAQALAEAGEVPRAIERLEQASDRLAAALRTLGLAF